LATYIKEQNQCQSLNKDQWTTFLDFLENVDEDLMNYDENAAWPVLLDSFVAWIRNKRNGTKPGEQSSQNSQREED